MKIYDTLIIGSGFFSAGYALKRGNCIICEKSELCDTHFYAPLIGFKRIAYTPVTEYGAELHRIFDDKKLFSAASQNLNDFESAFCSFLDSKPIEILLKCTVVSVEKKTDGTYFTTVHTNSGFEYICSKNVLNTVTDETIGDRYFTVLFTTDCIEKEAAKLLDVFPGSYCEEAFYKNRYALYIPADTVQDINVFKKNVLDKWQLSRTLAKILYFPPVYGYHNVSSEHLANDEAYANPAKALDAGVLYAGKE